MHTWYDMWWGTPTSPVDHIVDAVTQPVSDLDDAMPITHQVRDLHILMRDFLAVLKHRCETHNYELPTWALEPSTAYWSGIGPDPSIAEDVVIESPEHTPHFRPGNHQ